MNIYCRQVQCVLGVAIRHYGYPMTHNEAYSVTTDNLFLIATLVTGKYYPVRILYGCQKSCFLTNIGNLIQCLEPYDGMSTDWNKYRYSRDNAEFMGLVFTLANWLIKKGRLIDASSLPS
jgi:hypothetical protein